MALPRPLRRRTRERRGALALTGREEDRGTDVRDRNQAWVPAVDTRTLATSLESGSWLASSVLLGINHLRSSRISQPRTSRTITSATLINGLSASSLVCCPGLPHEEPLLHVSLQRWGLNHFNANLTAKVGTPASPARPPRGVGVADCQPLPASGHQGDSVMSALSPAHTEVFNKKGERHGQVRPRLGLHPHLPGDVSVVS